MQNNAIGTVVSLFISDKETKDVIQKETLKLDEKGIYKDRHYDKDISRSVLITSLESYAMVSNRGIHMEHGSLGENLLIDYNPYHLSVGEKLKIGTTILEISQPCTLCNHLASIDKCIPKLLKNDRGIFAKVIQAGNIKKGDTIFLIA